MSAPHQKIVSIPVMRVRVLGIQFQARLNSASAPAHSQRWLSTSPSEAWASADSGSISIALRLRRLSGAESAGDLKPCHASPLLQSASPE